MEVEREKKKQRPAPPKRQKSCLSTQLSFLSSSATGSGGPENENEIGTATIKSEVSNERRIHEEDEDEDDEDVFLDETKAPSLTPIDKCKSSSWPRLGIITDESVGGSSGSCRRSNNYSVDSFNFFGDSQARRYLFEDITGQTLPRPTDFCHERPVGGIFYVWYRNASSSSAASAWSTNGLMRNQTVINTQRNGLVVPGKRPRELFPKKKSVIYNAGRTKLILKSNGGVFYQKYYLEGGWGLMVLLCGFLVHLINNGLVVTLGISFGVMSCPDCFHNHRPHLYYPEKQLLPLGKSETLAS